MVYNEKSKINTMKYLGKLKEVRFRINQNLYEEYVKAQENQGYESMRSFIMAAIDEKIKKGNPQIQEQL